MTDRHEIVKHRISQLIKLKAKPKIAFNTFLTSLEASINISVSQSQAIEMLTHRVATKAVFEVIFEDYQFSKNNAVSVAMQTMLDTLEDEEPLIKTISPDSKSLDRFYQSVKKRATGIDNAAGKQHIIIELYGKFFKTAFPKMVEQLGIVYTPLEVVDFIIHSVNDVLKQEFGRSLSDENIHILDPFTGTGTFITRLLQTGLIAPPDLARKYKHELHANEIVLLAYYIAAINIENAYHDQLNQNSTYHNFPGIVLTDSFQLGETDDSQALISEMFPKNSARVNQQKKAPLRVIIGNPPYSVGQKSANDNAQNQKYENLDARIASTYAQATKATNKNALYDSYIKAFRWSTDRLDPKHGGVIAFVSNGAWLDGNSADGLRKCFEDEFSSIWVFNLRGNQRTSGELSRKEGGKIFGSGSRTPIAVTLLVKNPKAKNKKATIHYHDIGDYLNQKEKLAIIRKFTSLANPAMTWKTLKPNKHGDWLNKRSDVFDNFIPMGDKKDKNNQSTFFNPLYSRGLASARDAWCYNSNKVTLSTNINVLINFYEKQREQFHQKKKSKPKLKVEEAVEFDSTKITWNRGLKQDLAQNKKIVYANENVNIGLYRPFFKQYVYFAKELNDMVYQIPKLFPNPSLKNLVICVSGLGGNKDNTTIITDCIPDLNCLDSGTQCFPLHYYEKPTKSQIDMFAPKGNSEYIKRDGISDFILNRAKNQYGQNITKESIFYYVYGLLHSQTYRQTFANDLKKMLPRLPLVADVNDFWRFSNAGYTLAKFHLHYEKIDAYAGLEITGVDSGNFRVQKMRFGKKEVTVGGKVKNVADKSIIKYNDEITIGNIPAKAYDYVVNGKSAIAWIMERYQVKVDKKSGIKNDANDWAVEVGNERYILNLLLSVINVSMQTVEVVEGLPEEF